jgi:hypothetical protein
MHRSAIVLCAALLIAGAAEAANEWPQWGQNQRHTGASAAVGQTATRILDTFVYDPFVPQEMADPLTDNDLLVHYQVPLIDGNDVYMEVKSGQYTGLQNWETQIWNERKLHWMGGHLNTVWNFQSDWKPVPFGTAQGGPFWEPVFHGALVSNFVYVPGAGGSIFKVSKSTGSATRINPFGPSVDPDTFTAGPLTVDGSGNVYYNALQLHHGNAWNQDVVNSWLVKVAANGAVAKATFASLTPGAPAGNDKCVGIFNLNQLPWPPSPDAVAPDIQCGSQRPGVNIAPAVAADGTIYDVSVAHFSTRTAYLIAVNSNLTPKWQTSLRLRFNDGCGTALYPPNGSPGGCSTGAHTGVDPAQNTMGAGRVLDDGTSSPVIAPDGSIFYGAYTRYNYAQGHMMKFSSTGQFLASYPFGWDITPSIYSHDGTYSLLMKDNHYGDVGSYCNDDILCPPDRTANNPGYPEQYFISRLSSNLSPEWSWQNTNTLSCTRDSSGNVTCVSDHPAGFEWCVNAGVVDANGVYYANSEDGNEYVINPDGTLREHLFLNLALGAAYTPLAMTADGKSLAQNDGVLFVVGQ